ncbi:unnamed protein product [Microthlaspi erraticum]|uniref:Uncharacterized protein n=1 Tax=Microthlaspi erraticum TaxID=1685480 RepID=A0A6D2JDZ3_9BRAS|nr:unnamed protein product [Microthlaspi erraticum]
MQLIEQDEIPVKTLIDQGIDAEDVKKLEDGGIYTCNRLIYLTKKYLTEVKGIPESKVDKILEEAERKMIPHLTKNQKKELKEKKNKEQASAQTEDERVSREIAQFNAKVKRTEDDMLKLIQGLKRESDMDYLKAVLINLKHEIIHSIERKM